MKHTGKALLLCLLASAVSAQVATAPPAPTVQATEPAAAAAVSKTVASPDSRLSLAFALDAQGVPSYALTFAGRPVVKSSVLGLEFKDQPALTGGFTLKAFTSGPHDDTWEPVWGEVKSIRNHYNELAVTLEQASTRREIVIRFRVFDDGLGFRYELPRQANLGSFILADEKTQFSLTGDHKTFWIPGDYDTNEYPYTVSTLSEVDSSKGNANQEIAADRKSVV